MNIDFDLNLEDLKQYYQLEIIQKLSNIFNSNNFYKFIKKLSDKTIQNLIIIFNYNYYYDDQSLIPDKHFDILYNYALEKKIKIDEICYKENYLKEIELPEKLNSIKKFYPDDDKKLNNFLKKNFLDKILISSKLDGVSCLLIKNKKKIFLYTKGNTEKGRDISHILNFINFNTSFLKNIDKCVLRGELIINKKNKEFFNKEKSLRTQVIGLINLKKDINNLQKYIDVVFYQIFTPVIEHSEQFRFFTQNNILHPKYEIFDLSKINNITEFLSLKYDEYIKKEEYEIDGLVVSNPDIKIDLKKKQANEFSFAFKKNLFFKDVTVIDIIWNTSKDFKCIPILIIEPVTMNNTIIKKITGHNARNIFSNEIGIGSIIRIKLSGNIIPNIDSVIKTSNEIPTPSDYYWDDNKVNIYINVSKNDINIIAKKIFKYYVNFKIKKIATNTIESVIKFFKPKKNILNIFDYIDCIKEYFNDNNKFEKKILGIKKDQILQDSITKFSTESISIINILIATNKFKLFEETKFLTIFKKYPEIINILKSKNSKITDIDIEKLSSIDTINEKTIKNFLKGIEYYLKKKDKYEKYFNINYNIVIDQTCLNVVFSGIINEKNLSYFKNFYTEFLKVSKNDNITYVITKDENYEITDKIKKAKQYNIPIITVDKFYEILKKIKHKNS